MTDQLYRYEELLALHLADPKRLQECLGKQGQVILSLDGLQPDVGHEVLWVLRDCSAGEVRLSRSLLGATEHDLVALLEEVASVCQALQVPIKGVISDGQHSVRKAVASAAPTGRVSPGMSLVSAPLSPRPRCLSHGFGATPLHPNFAILAKKEALQHCVSHSNLPDSRLD